MKAVPITEGWEWSEVTNKVADDAVLLFAQGKAEEAKTLLTQHLTEKRGDTDQLVWMLVLDMYQMQRNKAQFEKVAEMFAKKFGVSPPSYETAPKEEAAFFSGRNVMILDGGLTGEIADKAKDFLKSSREKKTCRLDCGRVNLEESQEAGLRLWLDTMKKLRQYKVQAVLMGDSAILEQLYKKIEATDEQIMWLLLFELLQWSGKETVFEDFAYRFAVKFDLSPPGFDPEGCMKTPATSRQMKTAVDVPKPSDVLTEAQMNDWLDKVDRLLQEQDGVILESDWSHVERVTFEAAGNFSAWATRKKQEAKRLKISGANQWALAILNMVNALEKVRIGKRKY